MAHDEDMADDAAAREARDALISRFRVTSGDGFKLADHPTRNPDPDAYDKHHATSLLARDVATLSALQERLFAEGTWSLLLVFQAMDAAGKDSTIKHVMTGVNPQGVAVTSFKQPGPEDLAHDFLWRVSQHLPARGMIGIFNRSHYEEVLVARVHPEVLARQRLPERLVRRDDFWARRLESIADFERHLGRQGTRVVKFFLNVSRGEQRKRFMDRLNEPDKHWKFSLDDLAERERWHDYMAAYEAAIRATATEEAPWYVVPADQKWFMRLVVGAAVVEALRAIDPRPPALPDDLRAKLKDARAELEAEG